ncbi:MAG: antitoxin Xre/MbcA/ParS toxin-binding domain-containing protein [Terriglobales bacterium]
MQSTITPTAQQLALYLREWLGGHIGSELELASLAERGLPLTTVNRLTRHGLTRDEVHSLVIHRRTFKHRKSSKQRLSRDESDRAIRTARILARAQATLGDAEQALAWVRQPKARFEGRTPIQMMGTESGGRLVEEMLVQIDEGMFA